MADANTIHALAELLYKTCVEMKGGVVSPAKIDFRFDIQTRAKYATFLVPYSAIPSDLRQKITANVEKNVAAFLLDFEVICKSVDDGEFGRSFFVSRPPELSGASWDEIIGRKPPK